jgi:hypothetical protein
MSSAKQIRLKACIGQSASENPCLRCTGQYAVKFDPDGQNETHLCRFPVAGPDTDFVDPDGLRYAKCEHCVANGQDCLEVCSF